MRTTRSKKPFHGAQNSNSRRMKYRYIHRFEALASTDASSVAVEVDKYSVICFKIVRSNHQFVAHGSMSSLLFHSKVY